MSTLTPNYNLVKPSGAVGGDFVDVSVLDGNFDIIDTQIKNRANEIAAVSATQITDEGRITALEASPVVKNARVASSVAQSIPNNAYTSITFQTESEDTDNMFTGPSTDVTIKTAGLYIITGGLNFNTNATGIRILGIYKNGVSQRIVNVLPGGSFGVSLEITVILRLAVNDVINLFCLQNSGGALSTTGGAGDQSLQVARLSA